MALGAFLIIAFIPVPLMILPWAREEEEEEEEGQFEEEKKYDKQKKIY